MGKLPSPLSLAPTGRASNLVLLSGRTIPTTSTTTHIASSTSPTSIAASSQVRHATFINRPRRPYTFTQLVQLSDGSSYTVRTTSPQPLYRAAKDSRNTLLWQPSERSLKNVEVDEAGKLAAFRERFGRGFDSTQEANAGAGGQDAAAEGGKAAGASEADDGVFSGYGDLISAYAPDKSGEMKEKVMGAAPAGKGKKK